jgi:hypothetical protein
VHGLAIARFYVCKPGEYEWRYTDMKGCLAIVTESNLEMVCAHFLRLIDMEAFNPVCYLVVIRNVAMMMRYYHYDDDLFICLSLTLTHQEDWGLLSDPLTHATVFDRVSESHRIMQVFLAKKCTPICNLLPCLQHSTHLKWMTYVVSSW